MVGSYEGAFSYERGTPVEMGSMLSCSWFESILKRLYILLTSSLFDEKRH